MLHAYTLWHVWERLEWFSLWAAGRRIAVMACHQQQGSAHRGNDRLMACDGEEFAVQPVLRYNELQKGARGAAH